MKVAVLNWGGHHNFGDDVVLLEGIRQLFRGWSVHVFGDNAKSCYSVIDFDLVNKCDLFVLAGGEVINGDRLFIDSPWGCKIKIPKVALGCGVNVEKASQIKPHVVRELEGFCYVGLRDNVAVDILRQFPLLKNKVGLFYDLGFALDLHAFNWRGGGSYAVVIPTDRVNNRSDRGIKVCKSVDKSRGWLASELSLFDRVLFYPFGVEDNDDFDTCKKLSMVCRGGFEVFGAGSFSLESFMYSLSLADKVYPYRLHGLVLSYIIGAPFSFYPYHWKLNRVYDTVMGANPVGIRTLQREILSSVLKAVGF